MLRSTLRKTFTPIFRAIGKPLGLRVYDYKVNDFYWAVPEPKSLPETTWTTHSEMPGLRMNFDAQTARIRDYAARFHAEYRLLPAKADPANPTAFCWENASFGGIDALMFWCLLRDLKPKHMIEIGAGMSTRLAAEAICRNARDAGVSPTDACDFTTIDPYPDPTIAAGFDGLTRLIRSPVQSVPLDTFLALEAGDVLFIDSSHVLHVGSDVNFELLELVPRLKPGVIVHVHDIFLPREYPREFAHAGRFWHEQYLLQAFLAFNDSFEILWAGSYMNAVASAELTGALGWHDPARHTPGSFWFRRVR